MTYRAIRRALLGAALLAMPAGLMPSAQASANGWWEIKPQHPSVRGSGQVVKQKRPVADFRNVVALGGESVLVRIGPAASIMVMGDDNVLPMIRTEVRDGTLRIVPRGRYRVRSPVRVLVTTPELRAYHALGSGHAVIENVKNERFALIIAGSGDVYAKGRTRELILTINGSGRANLQGMVADSVQVALQGSGGATVNHVRNLSTASLGPNDLP